MKGPLTPIMVQPRRPPNVPPSEGVQGLEKGVLGLNNDDTALYRIQSPDSLGALKLWAYNKILMTIVFIAWYLPTSPGGSKKPIMDTTISL